MVLPPETFTKELMPSLVSNVESDVYGMIRNLPPVRVSSMPRKSSASSLGLLDMLPPELLLLALDYLDFGCLSRVSRVSWKGKDTIEGLTSYQLAMKNTPELLTALSRTRLLSCHSSLLIQQTLLSDRCVSCLAFGGFLFLPTCERICLACLKGNFACWMIAPTTAKRCFHLTEKQVNSLPILHTIPGRYAPDSKASLQTTVHRLVSVKQAKELAIRVHRSVEAVINLPLASYGRRLSSHEQLKFTTFRKWPLEPFDCDLSRLSLNKSYPSFGRDRFAGTASMRIPYLSDTGPDFGCICQGCVIMYKDYKLGLLPKSTIAELTAAGVSAGCAIRALRSRLRSRKGLLRHLQYCHGVEKIVKCWPRNFFRRSNQQLRRSFTPTSSPTWYMDSFRKR